MCNFEKAKELLNAEMAKVKDKANALKKEINSEFDKLIKNSVLDTTTKGTIELGDTWDVKRLGRFSITQLGEEDKSEFYGSISGDIMKDRIVLSLSIGMGGEEKIEQLERNRIFLCVKLYQNEKVLIDFANKYIKQWKELDKSLTDIRIELNDIRLQEELEKSKKELNEFNKTLVVGHHFISLDAGWHWDNLKDKNEIYEIRKDIDYTIQKITEKTLIVQQYGWKNSHIKRYEALSKLKKFVASVDGNKFSLNEEQIERLKECFKLDIDVQDAGFDIKEQQLYVWNKDLDERKPNCNGNEMLKIMYILFGHKWYLDQYNAKVQEAK